jgi:pimeloyl-ACP methyl ester carboxylesterase
MGGEVPVPMVARDRDPTESTHMLAERREHSVSEVPAREEVDIEVWPHWLGDESRPLAAFTHLPKSGWRDTGVVLCNPFGIELLSSRRAYRQLADKFAHAGLPALRFDYDGTGDSAGTDGDPNRVDAWLASIGSAIDELRRVSGVRRVVLFGVRLGALLARAYAAKVRVDGLILVACPATGKAHLREMKSLESLRKGRGEDETRPDGEQLSGFFLSHETAAALGALDLARLPLSGPCDALVASSDDPSTREERIVSGLSGGEASVTRSKTPGYTDMMRDDPYKSVVPDALWREVVNWVLVRSTSTVAPNPPSSMRTEMQIRVGTNALVREEIVRFDGMIGVLTEPAGRVPDDRPAVFLLNVGANHHIGSGRVYVSLARDWAAQGFRVLRFDRSGLGDSPARPGAEENYVFAPYGVEETQSAMSFLGRTRGVTTFVLAGVCSGAYYAYHSALADPRVVGAIIMNLPTFHWKEGDSLDARTRATFRSSRFYARAAFDPETLLRVVRGDVRVAAIVRELTSRAVAASIAGVRSLLDLDPILKSFRHLDSRRVSAFLLFADTDAGVDLIEKHLGIQARRMRRAAHFSMQLVSGAGHTFLNARAQQMLHEVLGEYLKSRFGPHRTRR